MVLRLDVVEGVSGCRCERSSSEMQEYAWKVGWVYFWRLSCCRLVTPWGTAGDLSTLGLQRKIHKTVSVDADSRGIKIAISVCVQFVTGQLCWYRWLRVGAEASRAESSMLLVD